MPRTFSCRLRAGQFSLRLVPIAKTLQLQVYLSSTCVSGLKVCTWAALGSLEPQEDRDTA